MWNMKKNKHKKTWQEKLADDKGFPKVFKIDSTKSKRWGTGTFVIPAPLEVNELMCRVPEGKLTTIDELRKVLAHRAAIREYPPEAMAVLLPECWTSPRKGAVDLLAQFR